MFWSNIKWHRAGIATCRRINLLMCGTSAHCAVPLSECLGQGCLDIPGLGAEILVDFVCFQMFIRKIVQKATYIRQMWHKCNNNVL